MWLTVLFAAYGLAVPTALMWRSRRLASDPIYRLDPVDYVFAYFVSLVVTAAVWGGVQLALAHFAAVSCVSPVHTNLRSLRSDAGPAGSFYVGSGTVRNQLTYFYLVKTGNHYEQRWVEAWEVNVFEEDREAPYVLTYTLSIDKPWRNFTPFTDKVCTTDLHVPKNSIDTTIKAG